MTALTSEIDEALTHLSQVPAADRGQGWHAYLDALLEQRSGLLGEQHDSQDEETGRHNASAKAQQ